ncbi:MAG: SAM-dependent DNA methyltransferase [Clostridia bacterium]|nr:SAM-dependent DNA methyltransferase [Clostridia bacterium]
MAERQVKSRERVADHGEVFTAQREVNAMLDLVKQETERIDSRFLEPACGDGNFLAEILRRKLAAVKARYKKSAADYEKYAVMAVTSIYGVDLLQDNVEECRSRLFAIWDEEYTANCKQECREECREAVRYILERNILCGNALTLKKVNAAGEDTEDPIIFSEWVFTGKSSVKRSDYRLDVLMNENPDQSNYQGQLSLFADEANGADNWMIDPDDPSKSIPKPIQEFSPVYYWKVQCHE